MIFLLNIIWLSYFIILLKKKYPMLLSMYWLITFYLIYIFVPMIAKHSTRFNWLTGAIIDQIAVYSFIGLLTFSLFNIIFVFKFNKFTILNHNKIHSYSEVNYENVKNLLIIFSFISFILFGVTIGLKGIISILHYGSRAVWLGGTKKNIFYTFAQLSTFYLNILGSVLVLSSRTKEEKRKAGFIFVFLIMVTSVITFARRHVMYPIFSIVFYKFSKIKDKRKIVKIGLIVILFFFIGMIIIGFIRTYGVSYLKINNIVNYFKYGNFIDIILFNVDFPSMYYFLGKQIMYDDISVSPLGYLKVFFALIPRAIWPDKPNYTSIEILSVLEPIKVSQGFSAGTG